MQTWEFHYMQQLTYAQQFIWYRAIKAWNNITDNLHSSLSIDSFKKQLKLALTILKLSSLSWEYVLCIYRSVI